MARRGLRANGDAVRECLSRNQASRGRRPQCADEPRAHAPLEGQLDHELGIAGAEPAPGITGALEQPEGRAIITLDERGEPAHALPPRAIRQAVEQRVAQAEPLPVVRDGDRDLGNLAIVGRANVARDA